VILKCPSGLRFLADCSAFSDLYSSSRLGPIRRDLAGFGQQMRLAAQWIATSCQEAIGKAGHSDWLGTFELTLSDA
jgi:hypothetical protein